MIRVFAFLYLILFSLCLPAQENKISYLSKNSIAYTTTCVSALDSENYSVYFAGELHGDSTARYLELDLLKRLYRDHHIKYYVLEEPSGVANLINEYLQTGDDKKLEQLLYYSILPKKGERVFFRDLRNFWISLPEHERFKIAGIDVNAYRADAVVELVDLYPDKEFDFDKGLLNDLLRLYYKRRSPRKKTLKVLQELDRQIRADSTMFAGYLQGNFKLFVHLLQGSLIGIEDAGWIDAIGMERREQYMYENVKAILEKYPDAKLFCQFGRAHVVRQYQTNWLHLQEWKSLAARLNTNPDSPVKGKVCTVLYYNTSYIKHETKVYKVPLIQPEDRPLFLNASPAPVVLFKLDAEGSPFMDMAERFQYLMLIKDK